MKKKIDLSSTERRNFMKWTLGMGAALGLKPWQIFEANESVVGAALATEMASAPVNRFIGNVMGTGGFAWMTQFWPHPAFVSAANTTYYSSGNATSQATLATNDNAMMLSPAAPFQSAQKLMSGFIVGSNQTHTNQPDSQLGLGGSMSMFAAIAALQQTVSPTLIPAISVSTLPYGAAAGAPQLTTVPANSSIYDLFSSAASRAGGALEQSSDAALFEAYYKANLTLQAAANLPTRSSTFNTGRLAAQLLGTNLTDQLKPTAADYQRYGITSTTEAKLSAIAETLITTFKAFTLNLTNMVLLPGMQDDPHDAFTKGDYPMQVIAQLGKIWDTFMSDMMSTPDPTTSGAKMGDNLVVTWSGDTPKSPRFRSELGGKNWGDDTPGGANYLYVLGNGYVSAGWHGRVNGDESVDTWDPATGQIVSGGEAAPLSAPAAASVLYAVTKGDSSRVKDFYSGDIDGITAKKSM